MNMNTILSKSIDYQTTKNPLQSVLDNKEQRVLYHVFGDHTNKGSFTICSRSNSRDLFGCKWGFIVTKSGGKYEPAIKDGR